ncbi:MAG: hypothetical protein AAF542_07885 [Pseudomonadota bacterium]
MNTQQLKSVMRFHLDNFSDSEDPVTNDTVHSAILSDDDGFGAANSKRIYKAVIRWTLIREGHEDKAWPLDWIDLTVNELSEQLL